MSELENRHSSTFHNQSDEGKLAHLNIGKNGALTRKE